MSTAEERVTYYEAGVYFVSLDNGCIEERRILAPFKKSAPQGSAAVSPVSVESETNAGYRWWVALMDVKPSMPSFVLAVAQAVASLSKHGFLQVTQAALSAESDLSQSDVRRALDTLCVLGWLSRESGGRYSGNPSAYTVTYPEGAKP